MKTFIKISFIFSPFVVFGIAYLAASFHHMDFNANNWDVRIRDGVIIPTIFCFAIMMISIIYIFIDLKTKQQ